MAFGLDDALIISSILASLSTTASQMGAFGSPGSSGLAGKPATGKTQPFQATNPFQGRPLLGATGKLSESLIGEQGSLPQTGTGTTPMSPFQQNELNMKLASAMRGK